MTLSSLPVGATAVVAAIDCSPEWRLRWAQIGLRPGTVVRVCSRTSGGGRILGIGFSRVAVDRTVLRAVTVEPGSIDSGGED